MDAKDIASPPLNTYAKAYQTENGIITFLKPQILSCSYETENKVVTLTDVDSLDLENLEVLKFQERKIQNGYIADIYMIQATRKGKYDNVCIELKYQSSVIEFNEWVNCSWFADLI